MSEIQNPSITLYAFHLRQDLARKPGQLRPDADRLWQSCANLSDPLGIPDLKSLPEKLPSQRERFIAPGCLEYESRSLQLEGSTPTVKIYPRQFHDTYTLDLTLYYQNVTIAAHQFSHLNPQGCLLARNIRASLGQTLVLYAEPTGNPDDDKRLANNCVDAFWQDRDGEPPFSNASGQLFGSPIFEYDNIEEEPNQQCHILVWLNRYPETLTRAEKTYFPFLNLLCCRRKILFAYHQARWCYRQTRQLYSELENDVKLFQELPTEPEARLRELKQKLTRIPAKIFECDRYLRDIEDHKTAISINTQNYESCLNKIREFSLVNDDLEFLENFLTLRSQHIQKQIQIDLSYLKPSQYLFEQMLGTIRSLVEIEQVESDRALAKVLREKEKAAEKREKTLERSIALIGTGLVVTGISSRNAAKPVEVILTQLNPQQSFDCPQAGFNPCLIYGTAYIAFHVSIGAIAAGILWVIIWLFSKTSK